MLLFSGLVVVSQDADTNLPLRVGVRGADGKLFSKSMVAVFNHLAATCCPEPPRCPPASSSTPAAPATPAAPTTPTAPTTRASLPTLPTSASVCPAAEPCPTAPAPAPLPCIPAPTPLPCYPARSADDDDDVKFIHSDNGSSYSSTPSSPSFALYVGFDFSVLGNVFVLGKCIVQFRETGDISVSAVAGVKRVKESAVRRAAKMNKACGEGVNFNSRTKCEVSPVRVGEVRHVLVPELVIVTPAPTPAPRSVRRFRLDVPHVINVEEEEELVVVAPTPAPRSATRPAAPVIRPRLSVPARFVVTAEVHPSPLDVAVEMPPPPLLLSALDAGDMADDEDSGSSLGHEDVHGMWSK